MEPWFDPNAYAWIPGTALGIAGGVAGTLTGVLAPRGKGKAWLLGLYVAVMIVCAGLLVAGVIALVTGQPYGVWYGLGLPGLLGVAIFGALIGVVRQRYRDAELRQIRAADLR
jgi:hypothetical protein